MVLAGQAELDDDETVGKSLDLGEVGLGDRCVTFVGAYSFGAFTHSRSAPNTGPLFSYQSISRNLVGPVVRPRAEALAS